MSLHLVTGGSGFVGSTIARRLIARGENVRVLDLWKSDALPDAVEFVHADINDESAVAAAMRGVDYVHHNVALVPIAKAGARFWTVNVDGTATALRCAAAAGVKHFAHMSSSAIFGTHAEMPITNNTPMQPVEIYGRAKKAADDLARKAQAEGALKTSCIRPRTVVGPGRLGIFGILFDWIQKGAPIFVIGDGSNLFQFIHSDDIADVSILACLQEKPGLYNVGTDRFGTLRQDLTALISHAGSRSKIVGLPPALAITALTALDKLSLSPLSPWNYLSYHKPFYFDLSPLDALGFKPRYSNHELLTSSYDWFVKNEALRESGASPHTKPLQQGVLKWLRDLTS